MKNSPLLSCKLAATPADVTAITLKLLAADVLQITPLPAEVMVLPATVATTPPLVAFSPLDNVVRLTLILLLTVFVVLTTTLNGSTIPETELVSIMELLLG